jgi:hypothetical protein
MDRVFLKDKCSKAVLILDKSASGPDAHLICRGWIECRGGLFFGSI